MNPMADLIDLLPQDRAQSVRRNYFLRLASLGALALAALAVLHGVLLIPAYAYVSQDIRAKETRLSALSSSDLTPSETAASAQLGSLTTDATYLGRLSALPTMSGATSLVLSVPHPGIALNSFSLTPSSDGSSLVMTVAGVASTREALHDYVDALEAEPWVKTADLPISAYAADTNVSFTITLAGSFIPS
jgi:Tfp pilus assembly protein PilN